MNKSHCACPNCGTPMSRKTSSNGTIKKGYFKTSANNYQPIPRYLCKKCGKWFSASTFKATCWQKKPWINKLLFHELCSGVTMSRAAKILEVNQKTVNRRFFWLARQAKTAHTAYLRAKRASVLQCQFDEMETYEHTKLKPLSIALAVAADGGKIIDAKVAEMRAKGRTARRSVQKYGLRKDLRVLACRNVIRNVAKVAAGRLQIACDRKRDYPALIHEILPEAVLTQYLSRKSTKLLDIAEDNLPRHEEDEALSRKAFDPLFMLNHRCAKLRADISRLFRRTWSTTKKKFRLQMHLYLYIAYHNGYQTVWSSI